MCKAVRLGDLFDVLIYTATSKSVAEGRCSSDLILLRKKKKPNKHHHYLDNCDGKISGDDCETDKSLLMSFQEKVH